MSDAIDVRTHKPLLEEIEAGTVSVGTIPCSPDRIPAVGEKIKFREATFEHFCAPTLVPHGNSVSATLTSVFDTHIPDGDFTLCTLKWAVGDEPLSRQTQSPEELGMVETG